MTLKSFLQLVELPTKVASLFPFLIGTAYAYFRYDKFILKNGLIMLFAMLALDMATTAMNNYMDYKKAIKTHGFNYEHHNAIVKHGLSEKLVVFVIGSLVTFAAALGILLYFQTNVLVLILGMISFFFAAIYTWGPVPISRTPLGELISGVVMGGIITFISMYIHVYDRGFVTLSIQGANLNLGLNIIELTGLVLVAMPLITGIANIMLANNICDMEDDFVNKRFTLPIVIGKKYALRLFAGLYVLGYLSVLIAVIFKFLSVISIGVLITVVPVVKHIRRFNKIQTKAETFILSVKNFILICLIYFISICMSIILY